MQQAIEQGRSLAEVAGIAQRISANGRSMGMVLTSCAVPAVGRPTFELAATEMEIDIGIHGGRWPAPQPGWGTYQ